MAQPFRVDKVNQQGLGLHHGDAHGHPPADRHLAGGSGGTPGPFQTHLRNGTRSAQSSCSSVTTPNKSAALSRNLPPSRASGASVPFTLVVSSPSSISAASRDDLPPCPQLRGVKIEKYPFACGGFSNIHLGEILTNCGHILVAIKVLRLPGPCRDPKTMEKINTRFDRESKLWNSLDHPNVLSFMGISQEFGSFPALISPFCPSGNLESYLKNCRPINTASIAFDITDGLRYLHSRGVIHGDIKSTNVLVGSDGQALICDFGVSRIIGCRGFTTRLVGTLPFMAPELFPDEDNDVPPSHTKETDVWAYGLVLLHVFTGKVPKLGGLGAMPLRRYYSPISDQLWTLAEGCCDLDPWKRPTMGGVMQILPSIDVCV